MGKFLYNLGVEEGFPTMTQSPDEIFKRIEKFDYIKIFFNCVVKIHKQSQQR